MTPKTSQPASCCSLHKWRGSLRNGGCRHTWLQKIHVRTVWKRTHGASYVQKTQLRDTIPWRTSASQSPHSLTLCFTRGRGLYKERESATQVPRMHVKPRWWPCSKTMARASGTNNSGEREEIKNQNKHRQGQTSPGGRLAWGMPKFATGRFRELSRLDNISVCFWSHHERFPCAPRWGEAHFWRVPRPNWHPRGAADDTYLIVLLAH